jgi:hypothetical protein
VAGLVIMIDASRRRSLRVAAWIFVATFSVGLLFVGDQAGAFADSEAAYIEIFTDDAHRVLDLTGSLLLIVAAVAFGTLAHLTTEIGDPSRLSTATMRVGGTLASMSMLVAGAAFLTVPASLLIGDFFGDPGLVTAQPVLPHFGYILLVVATTIPAATFMVSSTRLGGLPRWWRAASVVVAVLLVITSSSVITMLLLPIWVASLASVGMRHTSAPP